LTPSLFPRAVRPDLVLRVKSAVQHNGFPRQQDLVEEVGLASSTVRNFLNGKPVDYATFVEICQRLNLEWRDFADLGEITELHRESEEAVIARYSTSEIEKTRPHTLDLAERAEVITKPNIQIEESNTDLIEERIFRATEQLNRRGFSALVGIQALEEIAKDSPRYHWKIMELLAAFVRNAPWRKEDEGIPDDIQAALTVIGRRDPERDPENQKLNLSNTDIRGANLRDAKLKGINLSAAQLQGADLFQADLQRANLIEANLQEAFLKKANLQEASLHQATLLKADCQFANLQEAFLVKANLQEAVLYGANLQGAYLDRANLQEADLGTSKLQRADLRDTNLQEAYLQRAKVQGAYLDRANLQEADLIEADLQGTRLWRANLRGAVLQYANLEGAQLWRANLEGTDFTDATNLTQQQIDESTRQDSTTILPDYLTISEQWRQSE
jgi:uncharacterized protein YjbI with pentapeptide repeats/DNA-binding Xre family transcriptional regulator